MSFSRLGPGYKELKKWHSPKKSRWCILSRGEVFLAAFLGLLTEAQFVHIPVKSIIATTLACIAGLTYTIGRVRSSRRLPTKIFYVDFPVTGLCRASHDTFVFSGGGGGLAYGVEDATRLFKVTRPAPHNRSPDQTDDFLSINLFNICNEEFQVGAATKLRQTELVVGDFQPMMLLWGLSGCPRSSTFAGGLRDSLVIGRVDQATLKTILRLRIVEGSKQQIVHLTAISECGNFVAAVSESRDVCVVGLPWGDSSLWRQWGYALGAHRGDAVVLGMTKVDEDIIDVCFFKSDIVIVLLASGEIQGFKLTPDIANRPLSVPTKDTWGGPESLLYIDVLRPLAPMKLPHEIRPKVILALSENTVVIAGQTAPLKRGDRSFCVLGKYQISETSLSGGRLFKMAVENVTCMCLSDDKHFIGLVSNDRYLILDSRSLKIHKEILRSPVGSNESSFLPSTCCSFGGDYFMVGAGDYSFSVSYVGNLVKSTSFLQRIFHLERYMIELGLIWLAVSVTLATIQ